MPTVLVPLAQGCEELEAVTIIDLLRRAGIEVITAGLDDKPVVASRGVKLIPDMTLDEALSRDFTMLVLPGGLPGADNLNADARIGQLIQRMAEKGNYVAAICAAPKILAQAGLLQNKKLTHYPGAVDANLLTTSQVLLQEAVVCDGNIITSRGPGTAMDFALALIGKLLGVDAKNKIEQDLVR
jgi:protein deglycase